MGLINRVVNYIWPPRSLLGDAPVSAPGRIDAEAWRELAFIAGPQCARCGFPFQTEMPPEAVCGACMAAAPAFDAARAALVYNDAARRLVLDLKRGGRRDGLKAYGAWMARAGADVLAEGVIVAPVPLHWTKLIARRFNQAAWLADAMSAETGLPCVKDLLVRTKRRGSQGGLSAGQRARNVAGVFAASKQHADQIAGRVVVIVDDVLTTGATASACARAAKKAGAVRVCVITLARVVRPTNVGD
jgi:ComF family protein